MGRGGRASPGTTTTLFMLPDFAACCVLCLHVRAYTTKRRAVQHAGAEAIGRCLGRRDGLSARGFGHADPASVSIDVERPGTDFDTEIQGLSSQVSKLKQVWCCP